MKGSRMRLLILAVLATAACAREPEEPFSFGEYRLGISLEDFQRRAENERCWSSPVGHWSCTTPTPDGSRVSYDFNRAKTLARIRAFYPEDRELDVFMALINRWEEEPSGSYLDGHAMWYREGSQIYYWRRGADGAEVTYELGSEASKMDDEAEGPEKMKPPIKL